MIQDPQILVVDDDQDTLEQIVRYLKDDGFRALGVPSGHDALKLLANQEYRLVLLDLMMPGMNGYEVLDVIHRDYPEICVIVLTAHVTSEYISRALQMGAFDFIEKHETFEYLKPRIEITLQKFNLSLEQNLQREKDHNEFHFDTLSNSSSAMQKTLELAKRVAKSDTTVLLYGETGSGKNRLAQAIHHNSLRSDRNMVVANVAQMNPNLIESDFFGAERGAYSGAVKRRIGLLERANGSTLFIDEIGELPLDLQPNLLRFLQDQTFERLGGDKVLKTDVRIIAATNRDLEEMVSKNQFRRDLFSRLNIFPIRIPPLRERKEDIPGLASVIMKTTCARLKQERRSISKKGMDRLISYSFPYNIRELEALIERALILEDEEQITFKSVLNHKASLPPDADHLVTRLAFREAKKAFERSYIQDLLVAAKGNISHAAQMADMDRKNFKQKMQSHGLRAEQFQPGT
ncbi:response regulator [candidate division KSB1 bacterium]|nr:response regulator [candidate division KSB1 bacterium]